MAEEAPPAYALHRLRRLREQCRAFRESLPVEHRASFDELLRDTSAAVKAGASNIDVTIEVALSTALALALHERLSEVEGRLSALERSR
jgi:hypothetical protein